MSKWVILDLDGDFKVAGFRATLEIFAEREFKALKVKGFLPPNPAMVTHLQYHWQERYRPLGTPLRIKGHKIIHKGSINQRLVDCQQSAQTLSVLFRTWLNASSFQLIDRRLREEFSRDETIRFLIRTQDIHLQKLPWQEWDFFERYPNAEVALSTPEYESVRVKPKRCDRHPVRILAILGHSHGLDVDADRRVLAQLPQAQVTFLVEPDRQQLNDRLWEAPWDILFFAGHSETRQEQGHIHINKTDCLTLSELRYGLRKAIAGGLQLAIFNSCDGLGLVQAFQPLHLPQMIVMREPVADQVAAAFLGYFLKDFAAGEPFYLAVRHARERLQGLEHHFPCASWLPVIYQNPLVTPPDWLSLQGQATPSPEKSLAKAPLLENSRQPALASTLASTSVSALPALPPALGAIAPKKSPPSWWRVLWTSVLITAIVLLGRHWGLLQPFELAAYDGVMRSRPAEAIDTRILVVEVTQADLNEGGGYPLSDGVLAQTVDTLEALDPVAIALDIHRNKPRGEGRQALLEKFQQYANLFLVCAYNQADKDYEPPAEFSAQQRIYQMGFSNFALDKPPLRLSAQQNISATADLLEDCAVRRQLLSYEPALAATQSACTTPYSLSFQLAYQFLSQAGVEPLTVTDHQQWQFGSVVLQPLASRFGGYQNLDSQGVQLMVNYRAAQPGQQVTLQQVLTGQVTAEQVRDRLVLIGYTAPVARDSVDIPYGNMAGVWIHAHMVSQLLSAVLDQRPLIGILPQWQGWPGGSWAWVFAWALVGGGTGLMIRKHRWMRSRAFIGLGLVGGCWLLFRICVLALSQGIWLPLIPAMLAAMVTGICLATGRRSQHNRR